MTEQAYDVVVLGAGPAGENAAWYARDDGLSVAVVEAERVGGECSYWACIPSKALLLPVHALAAAGRLPGAAQAVTGEVDAAAVLARRDEFVSDLDDTGQAAWVDGVGATLVRGHGRLAGERRVEVTAPDGSTTVLTAERAVVVATGSVPVLPPVEGLAEVRPWDNREGTNAAQVPERLLVLGGGVVGCELSQAWRRLGSREVTVVQHGPHLLPGLDPWVGEAIAGALTDDGVTVLLDRTAVKAARDGDDGPVTLVLDDGTELVGDALLVATGRRAVTEDLGLETVGLEGGGSLRVDDRLRVEGVPGGWLYAIGDVNGRALLTHQGKYQGRTVADVIAGRDRTAWADSRAVPQVVFTDPEVASVGLTEQAAAKAGLDVEVLSASPARVSGGALLGATERSGARLLVDRQRQVVVGATFVGPAVGEMLHAATIAVAAEVPLDLLWHAVPAFPTVSEVWLRLLEQHRGVQ
jgi:pyruvate/2-oxoglutarate dehydrogenase complex dihydrolipoamide dehydrogenase (E3) component